MAEYTLTIDLTRCDEPLPDVVDFANGLAKVAQQAGFRLSGVGVSRWSDDDEDDDHAYQPVPAAEEGQGS